jgi:calcium-dependent protein kinase
MPPPSPKNLDEKLA